MSILITGMEMPTSCGFCPFKCWTTQGDECMYGVADMTYQGRPKDCPLLPVPKPHGDLIDRDKFRSTVFIGEQCLYSWDELEDAIDYAPTIIPADPAEEGE